MKAAFCPEPGRLEILEQPTPSPRPGEVLVRVRNCGVCGSDLHFYHGGFPVPPVCPGHEISGEVAEVGAGVSAVRPGDRVAVEPLIPCGQCISCQVGEYQLCRAQQIVGMQAPGGFAEYLCVPGRSVFSVPADLPWAVAALTEPMAVCVHGVRLANIRLGDRVLVLGAGTIGLLAALAAREAGASEVLITARHAHQLEAAERLGARALREDDQDGLLGYAFQHPIDTVIETVGGTADTLTTALFCVRPGGAVSVLGVFNGPVPLNALVLVVKEVRLIGSMTYNRVGPRADFDVAIDVLQRNRDQVTPLITHEYPLDEIDTAFRTAADKSKRSIKVSVKG